MTTIIPLYTYDGVLEHDVWFNNICLKMCDLIFNVKLDRVKDVMNKINNQENTTIISKIPHKMHRCWLTSNDNPFQIPEEKLSAFIESVLLHPNFEHYFWCIDKTKIQESINKLPKNVIIHEIKEIKDQMQAYHLYDALIKDDRYTNANDILRYNIIYLFGGLYADMGMKFIVDITDIIDSNEYCWWNSIKGKLDTSIFASYAGNTILNKHLYLLHNLYKFGENVRNITKNSFEQITWTGAMFLMATINSICTGEEKMYMFKSGNIVTNTNSDSWLLGLFGNKPTKTSKIDIFTITP